VTSSALAPAILTTSRMHLNSTVPYFLSSCLRCVTNQMSSTIVPPPVSCSTMSAAEMQSFVLESFKDTTIDFL
jgi:hypothetical protein